MQRTACPGHLPTASSPAGRLPRRPHRCAWTTHSTLSTWCPAEDGRKEDLSCSVFHSQHHCAFLRPQTSPWEMSKGAAPSPLTPQRPGQCPRKLPRPRDGREDAASRPFAESSQCTHRPGAGTTKAKEHCQRRIPWKPQQQEVGLLRPETEKTACKLRSQLFLPQNAGRRDAVMVP